MARDYAVKEEETRTPRRNMEYIPNRRYNSGENPRVNPQDITVVSRMRMVVNCGFGVAPRKRG